MALAVTATVGSSTAGGTTSVPRFRGLTVASARRLATRDHGRVEVVLRVPSHREPEGRVVSQTPTSWPVGLVVSTGPLSTRDATLAGEATGPVGSECAPSVQLSADGNAGPLLCGRDVVDVGAWLFYARTRPRLFSLGREASVAAIAAAACDAASGGGASVLSLPERVSIYELARAYSGWRTPVAARAATVFASHTGAACVAAFEVASRRT